MSEPTKGPERIWLQRLSEDYKDGWTWCWHDVGECEDPDVEYIRADAARELIASEIEARAAKFEADGWLVDAEDNREVADWLRRPTPTETTTK